MTQTMEPQQQTAWVPTDETFGARLALIRQGKKWRNVKMAALACGVPVATWRSWEERTTPGLPRELERVRQIADAAGVDYMWLLTGQAGGGGSEVRHQGLEPRTRWFEVRRPRRRPRDTILAAVHGRRALMERPLPGR